MLFGTVSYAGAGALSKHGAGMLFGKHAVKHVKVVDNIEHQELKTIKGKWSFSIFGHNFRFGYHGSHHYFRCCGYRRHFQGNYWRICVRGIGRTIFRISWF